MKEAAAQPLANRRRERGDGSLSRRKTRRGETWLGAFYVDGKRYMRTVGPVRTKAHPDGLTPSGVEAEFKALQARVRGEAVERERERHQEEAEALARENERTIEQVGRELIAEKEADGRKRSTRETYATWLDVHLIPHFGPTPVREITRADVEALKRALAAKRLKPKSIGNGLGTLSALMEFAVDHGYAAPNPVRRVRKPQIEQSKDIHFLTVEEVEAVVRAAADDDLGCVEAPMYLTAAMTGLRQGELLGLRWRDVDFTTMRLRVRHSFVHGEFGQPKSRRSSRSVPLARHVGAELERLTGCFCPPPVALSRSRGIDIAARLLCRR